MKKYKYIIFDFDGTINDTSQGIYHTFKKVLDILGINYDGVDFSRHIGPPLSSVTRSWQAKNCVSVQ